MATVTRQEQEVIANCMAAANDLRAILTRIATDEEFASDLLVAQRAGDQAGLEKLLRSTGSVAGLRIDGPPAGDAAARNAMPKVTGMTGSVTGSTGPNGTSGSVTVGVQIQFRAGNRQRAAPHRRPDADRAACALADVPRAGLTARHTAAGRAIRDLPIVRPSPRRTKSSSPSGHARGVVRGAMLRDQARHARGACAARRRAQNAP